jgi:hypothetical protein
MATKTLTLPEDAVVNLLKTLPEEVLIDIFWKTIVECDITPLSEDERKGVEKALTEFKEGKTIKWEELR